MKKVIVFGDLPIATKIVQFLETLDDLEIGVVIGNANPHNNDPWDAPCLFDYVQSKNIPTYTLHSLATKHDDNEFTLGLSCRFSRILKEDVISKFKYGIINMHGGLLPEFGGLCSANQTILHHSKVGGGTLHYIDVGIDTGNIIKRCEFEMQESYTAYNVFQNTQIILEETLEKLIPKALTGFLPTISQEELIKEGHICNYYTKKDLDEHRCIDICSISDKDMNTVIRAFDFPGYEPAYFLDSKGNKVYLRYTV